MPTRFEIYTPIHKGLRHGLSLLAAEAGKRDCENHEALHALVDGMRTPAALVDLHHMLEERFILPMLNSKVPGGAEILEEEHRIATHLLGNLIAYAARMEGEPNSQTQQELGFECYLALNRFIAYFWNHLDREEEHAQPTLWRFYTDGELSKAFNQLLAAQSPDQARANLELIFAASIVSDIVAEFKHVDVDALPKEQPNALAVAQQILSAGQWSTLKSRLELPNV
jgi:hemerythrin-like domain-containing protein